MNLVPVRPPGPNARKARAFAAEIARLRAQGYTFEAIREALADVGVLVSNSTVQREAARAATEHPAGTLAKALDMSPRETQAPSATSAAGQARAKLSIAALAPAAVPQGDPSTAVARDFDCKQDAEAFFAAHDSNPLSRSKETP
ncbi:MAG TPA: hypothetical protein PLO41_00845 [Rubrivivax sp.]|nr:hypothetical protein [Rubrivivax sp.]